MNETIKALLEKWDNFISVDKYKDIKSQYDAIQIAQLLENVYQKNKNELISQAKEAKQVLTEDGENYVPINGMQPSLILPIMRRMYPKIIMKDFVSTQTLPTPNAVVHYLRKIFKSSKNGVQIGEEFTGLPSAFDKFGTFNPFFSSELVQPASVDETTANQLTLAQGSITWTDEKGATQTTQIDPTDIGTLRRIAIAVNFVTTAGSKYNGWLIRGRNSAGYTGGISWKFTFFPNSKYVASGETSTFPVPTDAQFSVSATSGSLTIVYGGTDYTDMKYGWADTATGTIVDATKVGYYSVDPRKFPQVIPEMGIQIDTMPITLKDRSFKVRYNPKEEKIFEDYLNLNLASELVNEISDQMAYEIDREIKQYLEMIIIEDLREFVNVGDMRVALTKGTFYDPMMYLMLRIELFAAKMERINKMGRPNMMLVSPNIAALLNTLTTFKFYDDNGIHPAGGIYKVGSVPGKYEVYVDPQALDDTIILAHKHEGSPFGAGVVYAPYFSYLTPEIYDGDTGQKTRIMMMSYGLEKVPFGEYLYGAIHVSGINNIWATT